LRKIRTSNINISIVEKAQRYNPLIKCCFY
jgi:hypothetical protein